MSPFVCLLFDWASDFKTICVLCIVGRKKNCSLQGHLLQLEHLQQNHLMCEWKKKGDSCVWVHTKCLYKFSCLWRDDDVCFINLFGEVHLQASQQRMWRHYWIKVSIAWRSWKRVAGSPTSSMLMRFPIWWNLKPWCSFFLPGFVFCLLSPLGELAFFMQKIFGWKPDWGDAEEENWG